MTTEKRQLALTDYSKRRELILKGARDIFRRGEENLGVSIGWLTKKTEFLQLTPEETEELIVIRRDFGCLIPYVLKLVSKGFTIEDIYSAYRIQRGLQDKGKFFNVSITKLLKLFSVFTGIIPNVDDIAETITDIHGTISKRYFWVRYVNQSIDIVCAIGKEYNCASVESTLVMFEDEEEVVL